MPQKLTHKSKLIFYPKPPFHFDASLHKPSHFPSSDNTWVSGVYWITMLWQGRCLGLRLENKGSVSVPKVVIKVFSNGKLSASFLKGLRPELIWRFNFDADLEEFCRLFKGDKVLGGVIKKFKGMRPVAANSFYETLVIYIVLQNAFVGRSVQMLENLFNTYGNKLEYDGKVLSCFWDPGKIAKSTEEKLRELKLGYRAKFLLKLSEQFSRGEVDEFPLRKASNEEIEKEVLKIYGIGPASIENVLFEDFYRYDYFSCIPPWEQKILSKLLFNKKLVSVEKIFKRAEKWGKYKKLAIHYIWEDIFWKRMYSKVDWLEKEIRL
ncbi:hypothetical protein KKG58_04370 [Patescibacteria group bacterium]|nr:hypothetical protein [Patescibacteria group bacterium]